MFLVDTTFSYRCVPVSSGHRRSARDMTTSTGSIQETAVTPPPFLVPAPGLPKPRSTRQAASGKEKATVYVKEVDPGLLRQGAPARSKLNFGREFDASRECTACIIAIAQIYERVVPCAALTF